MGNGCIGKKTKQPRIKVSQNELNAYLNKFHKFRLVKLQNLFYTICQNHSKAMDALNFEAFKIMFKNITHFSKKTFMHLYEQFDQQQQNLVDFRNFISKLSIILYSNPQTFKSFIFNLYDYEYKRIWRYVHFQAFCQQNKQYCKQDINWPENIQSINFEQFKSMITQENFKFQDFKSLFDLLTQSQDQMHIYDNIKRNERLFKKNQKVYIISYKWYQKWCLYIQYNRNFNIKSSKIQNQNLSNKVLPQSEDLNEIHILPERPLIIQNIDLEGQFKLELKQNILFNYHYTIITEQEWNRLYSIYSSDVIFEREVIQQDLIQLYPKIIYFLNVDQKGRIVQQKTDLQPVQIKTRAHFNDLVDNYIDYVYYFKNVGASKWTKVLPNQSIIQLGIESQCFIVKIQNNIQIDFLKNTMRSEINSKNVTFGDKALAIHLLDNDVRPVYIMNIYEDQVKIHYMNYPFSYDRVINIEELYFEKEQILRLPPLKKKRLFKGLANVGNTCFINSIFQSILSIPILMKYINNKNQYKLIQQNKIELSLTQLLIYINKAQSENEIINSQHIKKIVDLTMPQFSGHEQHDAQQFLSILLDKLSQQLKIEEKQGQKMIQKRNIINELFQGSTQSKITCQNCKKQKIKVEHFYTLSLPLPEKQYEYFKLTVFPLSLENQQYLFKIGFKLNKASTLNQYMQQFAKTLSRNIDDYFLIQVDGSAMRRIISIKTNYPKKLSELFIRNQTNIIAFQKAKKMHALKKDIDPKEFEYKDPTIGSMIDYNSREKESWSFGKILAIDQQQKSGVTQIKIKDGKNIYNMTYNRNKIAPFLSKTLNISINYVKTIHRKYNLGTRKIQNFGIPFIASIPIWATYADVQEIVYRQMHMFLKNEVGISKYNSQLNLQDKFTLGKSKELKVSQSYVNLLNFSNDNLSVQSVEFKNEPLELSIPFHITILDLQSQKICPICSKEASRQLTPDKSHKFCQCIIDKTVPLSWIINLKQCSFSIDWKNLLSFNPNYGNCQMHKSYSNLRELQVTDISNLKDCMNIFSAPQNIQNNCESCHHKKATLKSVIHKEPTILIIHLKRFKYRDGFLLKLDYKINFPFQFDIDLYKTSSQSGSRYQLFAITCHLGTGTQGHYISYVLKQHPIEKKNLWVLYDDDLTSLVDKNKLLQIKAYILFYKKKSLPSSTYINYMINANE